jgi:hypothetical protein
MRFNFVLKNVIRAKEHAKQYLHCYETFKYHSIVLLTYFWCGDFTLRPSFFMLLNHCTSIKHHCLNENIFMMPTYIHISRFIDIDTNNIKVLCKKIILFLCLIIWPQLNVSYIQCLVCMTYY